MMRTDRTPRLGPQRGDDGAQPAGVEFVTPVLGPPVGQVGPGT